LRPQFQAGLARFTGCVQRLSTLADSLDANKNVTGAHCWKENVNETKLAACVVDPPSQSFRWEKGPQRNQTGNKTHRRTKRAEDRYDADIESFTSGLRGPWTEKSLARVPVRMLALATDYETVILT
jgi:hypothetical protein